LVNSQAEDEQASYLQQVLDVLSHAKLYGNLENYHFFTPQVIFLGVMVST